MEKNKEPALRILDLKNRFTFKERLSPEISGLKERLNFFSNFEIFETFETSLAFKNQFFGFFISLFLFLSEKLSVRWPEKLNDWEALSVTVNKNGK